MRLPFQRSRQVVWPETLTTEIAGRELAVAVRVNARSRSYRLSVPSTGRPVLTVPSYGHVGEAEAFVHRQRAWLEARLKRAPGPKAFVDGAILPVRGVDHLIVGIDRIRGRVQVSIEDGVAGLRVPGGPDHLARRLTDWLKSEAETDFRERVGVHAHHLGVKPIGLRLRGQSTRWGSCSSTGRLNFNWRLILAPPFVLDYVAAHEVAHLVEMNHSPAFWAEVERTLPDMKRGRAWLRAHGQTLMSYGA